MFAAYPSPHMNAVWQEKKGRFLARVTGESSGLPAFAATLH
jgi:hypothetical protein